MKWVSAGSFFWTSAKCLQMSSVLQCVYQGGLASLLPNPSKFAGGGFEWNLDLPHKGPRVFTMALRSQPIDGASHRTAFLVLTATIAKLPAHIQKFLASSVQSVSEEGYFCGPFSMAMLNYQRVYILSPRFTCCIHMYLDPPSTLDKWGFTP